MTDKVIKALRTCDAKRGYATKEKADNAASAIGKAYGKTLRSYECEMCGQWHLTKKAKAKPRDADGSA